MNQRDEGGIRLEFSDGRPSVTELADVNKALAPFGARAWPLDLRGAPAAVRRLLGQSTLSDAEAAQVREYFLLPRERVLEVVAGAGRAPRVPGGGEMSTRDSTNGVTYPQLYVVGAGVDYSRFDRFHANAADDGTGVDEVLQVLSGGGVRILQRVPGGGRITLHLDCVADRTGWIATYDGGYPHIGSISGGLPGTKVLVQVVGPTTWEMRYDGGA